MSLSSSAPACGFKWMEYDDCTEPWTKKSRSSRVFLQLYPSILPRRCMAIMGQRSTKPRQKRRGGDGQTCSAFGGHVNRLMLELFCPLRECGGFQQIPLPLSPSKRTTKNVRIGHITPFLCFPSGREDRYYDCMINLSLFSVNRREKTSTMRMYNT